jgi:hypothetical protein
MDSRMAVRTTSVEIPDGVENCRGDRVATGNVACIADSRHAHLQQLRVVAAMGFVAIRAVLHDRRMLKQEWTAPLCMAAQAGFVDRALNQLAGIVSSMRVVTACAGDFAFAIRHMRGSLQLCPPHLVALQAEFRLLLLDAQVFGKGGVVAQIGGKLSLPRGAVRHVAMHASYGPGLVRATLPEKAITLGMTRQAAVVCHFRGCIFQIEIKDQLLCLGILRVVFLRYRFCIGVRFARAVTRFTAQLFVSVSWVGHGFAHGRVVESLALILVTSGAVVGTGVVRISLSRGWLFSSESHTGP